MLHLMTSEIHLHDPSSRAANISHGASLHHDRASEVDTHAIDSDSFRAQAWFDATSTAPVTSEHSTGSIVVHNEGYEDARDGRCTWLD